MNSTKNVSIKKNKPKSDVLLSIKSFARSYQDQKFKKILEIDCLGRKLGLKII